MSRKFLMSFIGVASLALLAVGGCSKSDDVSTSVTNPNPNPFKPVGTIVGFVYDTVTKAPIVNAVVAIDGSKDTTDSRGSYEIKDVPATATALDDGQDTLYEGEYTIIVDARNAYSVDEAGVRVADNNNPNNTHYPAFTYDSISVKFTSLDDTECSRSAGDISVDDFSCTTASNHDTPVDGLAFNANIDIGKLACNITGYVYGCELTAEFATAQAGYEVRLVSDSSDNSATGASGNVLGQVTTASDGSFAFNNIECGGVAFDIQAADSFANPAFDDKIDVTGPFGDGSTLVLGLEHTSSSDLDKDTALHVCHNDDLGPTIIAISPEPGSDLAANSAETVTITFHEPVHQDPQTGTDPSGVDNLFDQIIVNFDGSKAGNVPYTLAWLPSGCAVTETCTQIQATFETGTSSLYHVTIQNIDGSDFLTDWAGNVANMGVCPDDSDAPSDWSISTSGSSNDCTIWFSTTGGLTPVAPTISLTNASSLDEGGQQTGFYDWDISTGAKGYDMFCRKVQVWKDGTEQVGPYVSGGGAVTVSGSSAEVDFDDFEGGSDDGIAFVENSEIALQYDCYVVGVSSDGVEGPASNIVRAEDVIGPILQEDGSDLDCGGPNTGTDPSDSGTICDLTAGAGGDDDDTTIDQIVLEFNEELEEEWAETTSNYAISGLASVTPPTFSSAVYSAPDDAVTLTLATPLAATEMNATRITSGADGVSNTTAVSDTAIFAIGSGAPGGSGTGALSSPYTSGGPCVLDRGPVTVAAGTDSSVTTNDIREIVTGVDGTCETAAIAAEGDVQLQPVSTLGRPSGTCVIITAGYATCGAGPDGATCTGDDIYEDGSDGNSTGSDFVHAGPNGVCETSLTGGDTGSQPIPLGRGVPNATSIKGGGDGLIDTETLNDGTGLLVPLAADDTLQGGKVTVTGVTDVNGNVIRTVGDEYYQDGSVR